MSSEALIKKDPMLGWSLFQKIKQQKFSKIYWFQQVQIQEQEIPDSVQIIDQMQQRKAWTSQEDKTLSEIVEISKDSCISADLDWYFISQKLKDSLKIYKTPKQCLDRWDHHLKPGSMKQSGWTYEEQIQLFELQGKLGNKWTSIASKFPTKSDSAVKNFFYATLRKSMRLINNFITQHRHEEFYKNFKTFPQNCIGKIISQDQNKKSNKMRITKANICESARDIKTLLLEISRGSEKRELIQKVICQISQFNRNCRRLRSKKRKFSQDDSNQKQLQKSSKNHLYQKNQRQRNQEQFMDEQSFSMKLEVPKSMNKQLMNIAGENHMFDCQGNLLLLPSESQGNGLGTEILTFTKENGLSQKVCIANLLNKMNGYQRIGEQYNSQEIDFPSFYLQHQQFSKPPKIIFDNYMSCLQDYNAFFDDAYQ